MSDAQRLLIAITALMVAGSLQIILALAGAPQLGIIFVLPAVAGSIILARPSLAMLGLVALYVAVEMLIPLHTGGGRIGDWDRHYQLSRAYAGLTTTSSVSELRQRTPLFNALIGSGLAYVGSFWFFQILSVILNALWLWPARLLLQTVDNAWQKRLIIVGLTPVVTMFAVYTWPWGFCSFFLLSALYFARQHGRMAAVATGIALGGALFVHIGSVGYVAGLGAYLIYKRHHWRITAVVGVIASSMIIPWVLFTTRGTSPTALFGSSVPAQFSGGLGGWLSSRPLLWGGTFWGIPPPHLGPQLLDVVISFFFFSIVAALLPLLLVGKHWPRLSRDVLCMVAGALVAGTLLMPSNTARDGFAETIFTGTLMVLIFGVSQLSIVRLRLLATVTATLAGVVAIAEIWRGAVPDANDPNLATKVTEHLVYFVDKFSVLPGIIVGVIGIGCCVAVWRKHSSEPAEVNLVGRRSESLQRTA